MAEDERTRAVIGAAMEVHRVLGSGHLEGVYQEALAIELELRGVPHQAQPKVEVHYKGRKLRKHYRPDFVTHGEVVVEIKAQSALGPIDSAQMINALKCCQLATGLLINFGEVSLRFKRFAN